MQKHEGYLGDLSPEQEKVLALLKEHIKANHPTPRPFDDAYLLRFCRAREFDIKKVILMFDNMMDWRKNNQVDEMHVGFLKLS
jgi:CRAL/TRIO, N-terminal domain